MNDNQQQSQSQSKKRRLGNNGNNGEQRDKEQNSGDNHSTQSKTENEKEGEIIQTALERAFLLTDIQSRMDGITTSGATVVCCLVIPKFSNTGNLTSISIHAANAGDARAVLSSCTARQSQKLLVSGRSNNPTKPSSKSSNSKLPNPELPNEFPIHRGTPAVRITHDHKSSDPEEIARIESSGGIMIRGRVLGVLAVARSLGDHGLKEYVIGRPYLSSTVVRIQNKGSGLNDAESEKSPSSLAAPLTDGEFLIVACDGLWDVMEDQETVDFVRSHVNNHGKESREKVASFLIEEALQRGSTDNITVIVYWL
mmetsp:Transcript_8281/g.14432  ORF Transcript_8281/g.14432 Transcript_8281/m.14432 type:complete len:311 (-) Transcript_8281:176-1108(-)